MPFIFTDKTTGKKIKSDTQQTCEEVLKLLREMKMPDSVLIITLPSGIGLDFEAQKDGQLWMEFYGDEPSAAFVSMAVAEEVVKRAFADGDKRIKARYADLVSKWEY